MSKNLNRLLQYQVHVTKRCYRSGSATFSTIHRYTKICFDPIGIGKQETIHKHTQVKNNIIAMQHAASCQLPCVRFWPKTCLAKCANSHSATTSVIKTFFTCVSNANLFVQQLIMVHTDRPNVVGQSRSARTNRILRK